MNNLNTIATIFYSCCNIPILILNDKLDELYKCGYDEYFNSIYPKNLIEKFFYLENNYDDIVSIENNIQYILVKVSSINYIIGPIKIDHSYQNNKIPYRPSCCIKYIKDLLLNIIDNNLTFNIDYKYYNTYIRKSIRYIHENYNKNITIDEISDYLNINKSYFCNLFKESTGVTFSYFLNYLRIEKSKNLLLNTDLSLLDIAIEVGYNSQNYFTIIFKKYLNQTPSQYRKKGLSCKKLVY